MKYEKEDFTLTTNIPPTFDESEEEKTKVDINIIPTAKPTVTRIFREAGAKFLVKVLSDKIVDDMRMVELECLDILRPSRIFGTIPVGEKFTVSVRIGWEPYAGWDLEDYDS